MFILILFKKMSKILVKILTKKKSNIQTLYDLIRIILRDLEQFYIVLSLSFVSFFSMFKKM